MALPKRGDIWLVDLESKPAEDDDSPNYEGDIRREIRGSRPALILSNDHLNQSTTRLAMVVPCTTDDWNFDGHIRLSPPEGGVEQPTFLMCDQLRAIDRTRFDEKFEAVSSSTMQEVEELVRRYLSL